MHVVERTIQTVVPAPSIREVRIPVQPRNLDEWVNVLDQLSRRLDAGLLYARDLPTLRPAMERLVAAYNRREDGRR